MTVTMSSILRGTRSANQPDSVKAYLDEWVYGVKDREEYWEKLGAKTHKRLKVKALYSEKINYGNINSRYTANTWTFHEIHLIMAAMARRFIFFMPMAIRLIVTNRYLNS